MLNSSFVVLLVLRVKISVVVPPVHINVVLLTILSLSESRMCSIIVAYSLLPSIAKLDGYVVMVL